MDTPRQIALLEANAAELVRQGLHEDARRVYALILDAAPGNVVALRFLARYHFDRFELEAAQRLLERAIRARPSEADWHQDLGMVLGARGFPMGALRAFDEALRHNPSLVMAWIKRGEVLLGMGRQTEAIKSFLAAERLCGDLVEAARQLDPQRAEALQRAHDVLAHSRAETLQTATASHLAAAPSGALRRAQRAAQHMFGLESPAWEDPLQRPTFAHFPGLGPKPFFPRSDFAWIPGLEDAWEEVRAEFVAAASDSSLFAPYVHAPPDSPGPWRELNDSPMWSALHLYRAGERIDAQCARCPRTAAALESLPLIRLAGHTPEAFFSVLHPNTHIPPHTGLANYKLTVHLPLIVPDGCAIKVGDETRVWSAGKALVFDDSFEHEAWNRGPEKRVVLIFEIWHPDVNKQEREYLAAALGALTTFNERYST